MTKIALGTQYISGVFNGLMVLEPNEEELSRVVNILEDFITAIDTAPVYGRGCAEAALGKSQWTGPIWTKVGVDICQPIPKLDYALEAMHKSLMGSLNRLNRQAVELVMLHNPPSQLIGQIKFRELHEYFCLNKRVGRGIGISLANITDFHFIKELDFNYIDAIMVETPYHQHEWSMLKEIGKEKQLIVRGIFYQGKEFKKNKRDKGAFILERLEMVFEEANASYCVIAPRNTAQAYDYLSLLNSCVLKLT